MKILNRHFGIIMLSCFSCSRMVRAMLFTALGKGQIARFVYWVTGDLSILHIGMCEIDRSPIIHTPVCMFCYLCV